MPPLSSTCTGVILAKNEQLTIEQAIRSLSFCTKILVYNDHSTDKTVSLAKEAGATIVDWDVSRDFSAARNDAMNRAKTDWVLFIDADEVVSAQLQREIQQVVSYKSNPYQAYYLRRRDWFWGEQLNHGELKRMCEHGALRLMRPDAGWWKGKVHERFSSAKATARLDGFIEHYPHPTIAEFLTEINTYSTIRAHELATSYSSPAILVVEMLALPPIKFVWTYILQLGFLDGPAGFVYSFMMSFHSFLARAKAYQYTRLTPTHT